jgi:hypothetical protein
MAHAAICFDHGATREDIAKMNAELLAQLSKDAGLCSDAGSIDGKAMPLIRAAARALHALEVVALQTAAWAARQPRATRKEEAKVKLFNMIAPIFLRLHGRNYLVSNRNVNASRDNVPSGPAIDWTIALFELLAERARSDANADHHEIIELACWAKKSRDGLAQRISASGRRGKSERGSVRVKSTAKR